MRDAFHGFSESARQSAAETVRLTDERSARSSAAVALAQAGDTAQAEKLINDLDRAYPADTVIKYAMSPAVRALVLMRQNDTTRAVAALEPARKYDLAFPVGGGSPAFLVMYVSGLPYLQAQDCGMPAAEFQSILDHIGLNTVSVFLPLAQFGFAPPTFLPGDSAQA